MKKGLFLISLTLMGHCFAWGRTGHRAVGEIAQDNLTKKALKSVMLILDNHSLAKVSIWPDEIKSDPDQYRHTFSWHWTDWPDDLENYDPDNNTGSLITAIEDQLKVIRNSKSTKEQKAFALKFLVHLVGDLHMPLHIGNGLDRGGNNCMVTFHSEVVNLHQLWDEKMIDFTKLSFTEFKKFVSVVKKSEISEIQSGSVLDWAKESKNLRLKIYPEQKNGPKNVPTGQQNYCQKDTPLSPEQLPQLGYEYSYVFLPQLEKRILQAGLRLAWLLNSSL